MGQGPLSAGTSGRDDAGGRAVDAAAQLALTEAAITALQVWASRLRRLVSEETARGLQAALEQEQATMQIRTT